MSLAYSKIRGFYINIKSVWLTQVEFGGYLNELEIMRISLLEAKK